MKKHILGFAVFSFIFLSFAAAFAYFYAPPIPPVAVVKQPVYRVDTRTSCRTNPKKEENVSYEVISAQYDYDRDEVVSRIKLTWNGNGVKPKRVTVASSLTAEGKAGTVGSSLPQIFENPFSASAASIVTVETPLRTHRKPATDKNLYAYFVVTDENSKLTTEAGELSGVPTPVVFVHGEKSISRK